MSYRFFLVEQEGSDIVVHISPEAATRLRAQLNEYENDRAVSKFYNILDLDETLCTIRLDKVVLVAEITEESTRNSALRRAQRHQIEKEAEGWRE